MKQISLEEKVNNTTNLLLLFMVEVHAPLAQLDRAMVS